MLDGKGRKGIVSFLEFADTGWLSTSATPRTMEDQGTWSYAGYNNIMAGIIQLQGDCGTQGAYSNARVMKKMVSEWIAEQNIVINLS